MTTRRLRRSTFWMPFSEGPAFTTLAPGSSSRLFIASVREGEVGREMEGYTVTRTLINVSLHSASAPLVATMGMITQHEDITLALVTPSGDPMADWMWHEEFLAPDSQDDALIFHRDIRSQRKARGGDAALFIYVDNRSGVSSLEVFRAGRVLAKHA